MLSPFRPPCRPTSLPPPSVAPSFPPPTARLLAFHSSLRAAPFSSALLSCLPFLPSISVALTLHPSRAFLLPCTPDPSSTHGFLKPSCPPGMVSASSLHFPLFPSLPPPVLLLLPPSHLSCLPSGIVFFMTRWLSLVLFIPLLHLPPLRPLLPLRPFPPVATSAPQGANAIQTANVADHRGSPKRQMTNAPTTGRLASHNQQRGQAGR
jgi:hypothetical protein